MRELSIESSAFSSGGEIPKKYGYKNDNVSPPIEIRGVPSNANSLALIMDDPDAMKAVGKVWVHWIIWNIDPTISEISEGSSPSGSVEGKTDFGEIGYGGPAPPDKRHTYIFKLFALETKLDLKKGSTKAQLEKAMNGQILDQAILKGTFAP
ncbi:MAG: YbhB/YbcL family Raf kinase inhibitor-like protein [Nitrosopumilaceae archaeon]